MGELNLVFKGIGTFHIAYFKNIEHNSYYGSTKRTFSSSITEEEILEFFKDKNLVEEFVWLGSKFDCEPEGGILNPHLKINLVTKKSLKNK